jgi:HEAT repeat protein
MHKILLLSLFVTSLFSADFDRYRQQAWRILEEGSRKNEKEVQLLTLFGAQLSQDEGAMTFFMKGLKSEFPEVQLASIRCLAALHHDRADEAILDGLKSNELLIRLETLYLMAQRGLPGVADQVEGLMAKIPPVFHSIFPPLFALSGDPSSLKRLRLLLSDPDDKVRASAVLSVEKAEIEELLPHIRRLCKGVSPLVQEAAVHCLGSFGDSNSLPTIKRLINSSYREVRLTALQAMILFDGEEALPLIEKEALSVDTFAISLLGKIPGGERSLKLFLRSKDPVVVLNAGMALLERGDREGLKIITPLLFSKKGALAPNTTPLKTVTSWKIVPQDSAEWIAIRPEVIRRIFTLAQEDALLFAKEVLENGDRDLLPALMEELYNLGTPEVIALLEKYQQKVGAPYVRGQTALTLFRLGQKNRRQEVITFLKNHHEVELIKIKEISKEPGQEVALRFELSPEEASSLYIKMLEALLAEGKEDGISLLVEAMDKGHPNNKYALAGLLIRATL